MKFRTSLFAASALFAPLSLTQCSADSPTPNPSTGGAPIGGAGTGGSGGAKGGSAGASTGGTTGGQSPATGGSGGSATGGVATGGVATGGTAGGGAGRPNTGGGGSTAGGGSSGGLSTSGAGGTMTGGAGGGAGGAIEASFATLKAVIMKSCFGGLCHNLPENPLNLTVDDKLYTTLTTWTTETCGPLLKMGSPSESALSRLLKGPCNGTDRMPFNMCYEDTDEACVPANYIAAIDQWITNGAPQQ